jgi:23S rRNA G2069 N7-methylase RlmK/C1962 C5-methylase RlmI
MMGVGTEMFMKILKAVALVSEALVIVDNVRELMLNVISPAFDMAEKILEDVRGGCEDIDVACQPQMGYCYISNKQNATIIIRPNEHFYTDPDFAQNTLSTQLNNALQRPEVKALFDRVLNCFRVTDEDMDRLRQEIDKLKQLLTLLKMVLD